MKNIYCILTFIWMLTTEISAQNLFTEDFIYAPVDSLENSGDWFRSGIDLEYNIKVVSPGLEYKDYAGSGRGNSCLISNSGNGDVLYHHFSEPVTSGAAYLSFMFRVDSLPATVTEGYCIAFNPNSGGTNLNTSLSIKRLSNRTFNLGVQKQIEKDINYANAVFEIQKTYLIVLKYSIKQGVANDSSSLYVFERGVPAVEPIKPMATTIDGDDYTGQASVVLVNNYAQSGLTGCSLQIDGIRVGNSWATSVLNPVSATKPEAIQTNFVINHFPNPFHQKANISFEIPSKGLVQLSIFNESGFKCTTLLHAIKESGKHHIVWDAEQFPAGLYHCNIQFNDGLISRKMLLIK